MRTRHVVRTLALASLAHAAVDAACALLLFSAVADGRIAPGAVLPSFLAYGLLAFGTQPLIGYAADRAGAYRVLAVGGALGAAAAPLLALAPGAVTPAIVLAGLANASFHVGAGVFALRATPGRALAPGIFVAPGAAGLALGTVAGRAAWAAWPFALTLAVLALALGVALAAAPAVVQLSRVPRPSPLPRGAEYVLLAVMLVITVRAFVGTAMALPWKTEPGMLIAITVAIVAGKAAGGVLADRWGRVPVGAGTLLLAAPLLAFGASYPLAGLLGLLAFNVTMPITLVVLADVMPEFPGTAFGLTCVALIAGAFPSLVGWQVTHLPTWVIAGLVAGSAGVLGISLARMRELPVQRVPSLEGSTP